MKLNSKITNLLFELSEAENKENCHYLIGDGSTLRNNLLRLYRATHNPDSQELIIKVMVEAGYPWFEKLARSSKAAIRQEREARVKDTLAHEALVSEQEFLSLLPANEYVH